MKGFCASKCFCLTSCLAVLVCVIFVCVCECAYEERHISLGDASSMINPPQERAGHRSGFCSPTCFPKCFAKEANSLNANIELPHVPLICCSRYNRELSHAEGATLFRKKAAGLFCCSCGICVILSLIIKIEKTSQSDAYSI